MVHREPVIELIGVDPYKFAEIRSLGLINETIDWKQRFFVPTDEETGIAALTDLLSRYPVLPSDVLSDEPIADVIAYFKSLWSPEHRRFQEEQNLRPPMPTPGAGR